MASLIERLRIGSDSIDTRVCDEAADEVERCWAAIEQDGHKLRLMEEHANDLARIIAERDAEIERLKNATDHAALDQAWVQGYLRAVQHSTPIIHNLLKAAASAPSEDHHHG